MIRVYSKIELPESTRKKVLAYLSEKKYDISTVEYHIDESIISGIKIDIDSYVIDLTLNNRLDQIVDTLRG